MSFILGEKENLTLEDLRWKNRIVIYFPAKHHYPQFDLKSLEDELSERKIIFLSIPEHIQSNTAVSFDKNYLNALRENLSSSIAEGNWILIGLDGGIKLNKKGEPDWDYIFRTIDSMPMRQLEIKRIK
ncbi:DUF4174 domain-containing protein [Aquiflexum gelatinilyticum]|uniref:DUF4174 domain-containing protein n=1 Tax=Aquiflexum gelatinilyticum TaxID=2961943 RepID=A0A9X2P7X4_9BACT|nr:DUF4174 domain-containing protein [Aquiflexum gelatinilyticum]MCR9015360.1 DUF4174 domain-containing protein [Aquiflexum gelatinilyticum]